MIHPVIKLILTFLMTFFLIRMFIPLAIKLNWVDEPTERKQHSIPTPHVGGIAIFIGFLFGMLLQSNFINAFHTLLISGFVLILFGVLDDIYKLSVRLRLSVQLTLVVFMMTHGGVLITSIGHLSGAGDVMLGGWSWLFTVISIIGFVNAFNMMDGVDGLAGGLAVSISIFFLYFSWQDSSTAGALMLLIACLLGFLCFNVRSPWQSRAAIFLGDAGSTFLGFALAWFAIELSQSPHAMMSPVTILWILAVPIYDFFNVFINRLLQLKSPFLADRSHIHHLLLGLGMRPQVVTSIMIFTSILLGFIGYYMEAVKAADSNSMLFFLIIFVVQFFLVSISRLAFRVKKINRSALED